MKVFSPQINSRNSKLNHRGSTFPLSFLPTTLDCCSQRIKQRGKFHFVLFLSETCVFGSLWERKAWSPISTGIKWKRILFVLLRDISTSISFKTNFLIWKKSFWCKLSQEYDWVAMTFIFCPSVRCFRIKYRFPIGIWPMMIEEAGSVPPLFRFKADSCPNYFLGIFFLFNSKVFQNW